MIVILEEWKSESQDDEEASDGPTQMITTWCNQYKTKNEHYRVFSSTLKWDHNNISGDKAFLYWSQIEKK